MSKVLQLLEHKHLQIRNLKKQNKTEKNIMPIFSHFYRRTFTLSRLPQRNCSLKKIKAYKHPYGENNHYLKHES